MASRLIVSSCWAMCVVLGLAMVTPSYALLAEQQAEPQPIEVAAYEFPPYYSSNMEEHLLGALLSQLNERQQTYHFTITEVRVSQRYQAFDNGGCCELVFFENPRWGWEELLESKLKQGALLTRGADLYMSLEDPLKTLQGEVTVGGVQGYHYNLTNYQQDSSTLEREHSLYLANNQMTLIHMLRRERLDVIIVSDEFVRYLEGQSSPVMAGLEYKTAIDQEYGTYIFARQDREDVLARVEEELAAMLEEGSLGHLFEQFGLAENLYFEPPQETAGDSAVAH